MSRVLVVGAGISGVVCAQVLRSGGVDVRVRDRGRRLGGRMAVRTVDGRPVDAGASYFTARDPDFSGEVARWVEVGLAQRWTDTFHVADGDGLEGLRLGPMRYSAPAGLRTIVEALAQGLEVEHPHEVQEVCAGPRVDGERYDAVVLAMPDPQAADLLGDDLPEVRAISEEVEWEPSLALLAGWAHRSWPEIDGVFVNESPVLSFIADDGRRRGDGAPVLTAHATAVLAARYLDDVDAAAPVMLAELRALLGVREEPTWSQVRRWSLARPAAARPAPFYLGPEMVGLCGDGWHGTAKIETAWLSGRDLGRALLERL
ncbi:MAG: NAD(P)/FAD-dependent oxidoreductase [Actinomycetes bacterium]